MPETNMILIWHREMPAPSKAARSAGAFRLWALITRRGPGIISASYRENPADKQILKSPGPVLAHQVTAEAVVAVLAVQGESGPLVYPPGVGEDVVGPQGDLRVPGLAGEPEHLLDQPGADAQAPRPRLDEQQPQPRGRGVLAHAEHAARRAAVDLGDPGRLGRRVPAVQVVRDDPGHERLVGGVPAELRRV